MVNAVFAGGCFWHVQEKFAQIPGVVGTQVGYTGGELANPTYEQVCQGESGHAEAVRVIFDQQQISYAQLCHKFWMIHDPTQLNRQGVDVGRQYRSAIFTVSEQQRVEAEQSKAKAQKLFSNRVVTEIVSLQRFWLAEKYHQHYLRNRKERLLNLA